jgi:hypothetical protein
MFTNYAAPYRQSLGRVGIASTACHPSSADSDVDAENDEVEVVANFAFDVERLGLCPPCSSSRNPSSEPTPRSYGLRGD